MILRELLRYMHLLFARKFTARQFDQYFHKHWVNISSQYLCSAWAMLLSVNIKNKHIRVCQIGEKIATLLI